MLKLPPALQFVDIDFIDSPFLQSVPFAKMMDGTTILHRNFLRVTLESRPAHHLFYVI